MKILPEDLRVESYRTNPYATGMGVWRASTAVKVTHIPTGLTIICDTERSMYTNRVKAIEELETAVKAHDAILQAQREQIGETE